MISTFFSLLSGFVVSCFMSVFLSVPTTLSAHRDTYNGPMIITAKQSLEKGDVTSLLKWVKKEDEEQIKAAFTKTMAVRLKDPEAKKLADSSFFETLVGIHRAGESALYTGLRNEPVEPIVTMSDNAVKTGNADVLAGKVATYVKKGIKERFAKVLNTRKNAEKSVEEGREYVKAYNDYLHYVTGIHSAVMSKNEYNHESGGVKVTEELLSAGPESSILDDTTDVLNKDNGREGTKSF
jgi:hypothetical protein